MRDDPSKHIEFHRVSSDVKREWSQTAAGIAEQCRSDRVEKVVMDGPKVVEDDVMDGQRIGKYGKVLENVEMD